MDVKFDIIYTMDVRNLNDRDAILLIEILYQEIFSDEILNTKREPIILTFQHNLYIREIRSHQYPEYFSSHKWFYIGGYESLKPKIALTISKIDFWILVKEVREGITAFCKKYGNGYDLCIPLFSAAAYWKDFPQYEVGEENLDYTEI